MSVNCTTEKQMVVTNILLLITFFKSTMFLQKKYLGCTLKNIFLKKKYNYCLLIKALNAVTSKLSLTQCAWQFFNKSNQGPPDRTL